LLGRTLESLDQAGLDGADRVELRRLLYGLHAIMRLHNAREEEAYGMLDAANAAADHS
jgi:hypothetical protein